MRDMMKNKEDRHVLGWNMSEKWIEIIDDGNAEIPADILNQPDRICFRLVYLNLLNKRKSVVSAAPGYRIEDCRNAIAEQAEARWYRILLFHEDGITELNYNTTFGNSGIHDGEVIMVRLEEK